MRRRSRASPRAAIGRGGISWQAVTAATGIPRPARRYWGALVARTPPHPACRTASSPSRPRDPCKAVTTSDDSRRWRGRRQRVDPQRRRSETGSRRRSPHAHGLSCWLRCSLTEPLIILIGRTMARWTTSGVSTSNMPRKRHATSGLRPIPATIGSQLGFGRSLRARSTTRPRLTIFGAAYGAPCRLRCRASSSRRGGGADRPRAVNASVYASSERSS